MASLLLAAGPGAACGDGNRGEVVGPLTSSGGLTGTSGGATDGGITGTGGDDDGASGGGSTSDGSGNNPKFDVADGTAGGSAGDDMGDEGCAKVDLLFVVDNSTSMEDNQKNLADNVPGFVTAMQEKLGDKVNDYHIGVVTSDEYRTNIEECKLLGALVTQTGYCETVENQCWPFAEPGARYLTEDDDIAEKFPCMALVNTCGHNEEKPMGAALAAIGPDLNAAGACNDGFIREDAVLVVVFVSDEPDTTEGTAEDWFQEMVGIKGVETNIVIVSLIGWGDNPQDGDICNIAVGTNDEVAKFTEMFTHGFIDHVCSPSYGVSLDAALDGIQSACDDFVPPG